MTGFASIPFTLFTLSTLLTLGTITPEQVDLLTKFVSNVGFPIAIVFCLLAGIGLAFYFGVKIGRQFWSDYKLFQRQQNEEKKERANIYTDGQKQVTQMYCESNEKIWRSVNNKLAEIDQRCEDRHRDLRRVS